MMKTLFFLLMVGATVNAQGLMDDEIFSINPAQDTVLTTNLGSQVSIPKAAFQDRLGNSIQAGIIEVSIKEVANQKDMVLEGLSTSTKDGILVSNGMIRIEAASNGQKIELAKNKAIGVKIPAQQGMANMSVYSIDQELNNWEKTNAAIKLDTCASFWGRIITREKTVSRAEYKKWERIQKSKKKEAQKIKKKEEGTEIERLFGGRSISIRPIGTKRAYSIPIAIDTVWSCDNIDVSYYSFTIQSLGWYNIDKLKQVQDPVQLIVTTTEDLDVFLLLANENVCLRGYKKDDKTYEFKRIPGQTFATIVAYRQNDAATINVSIKTLYLKGGKAALDPPQKKTVGEFRRLIKMMRHNIMTSSD